MPAEERTWIVMLRDVSESVRVRGEPVVMAGLVLDMGTGLVLGQAVGTTGQGVLGQALTAALAAPTALLVPGRPDRVLCAPELVVAVEEELADLHPGIAASTVAGVDRVAEAEDVFDSLTAHLAGRAQPDEFATPGDWALAVHHALRYRSQEPWARWADSAPLALEVIVSDELASYVATVIGSEGIQRGLVLHPGTPLSSSLDDWDESPASVAAGTLMFFLDPPAAALPGFFDKAIRYGWPADAELVPVWAAAGSDGAMDVSRRDVCRLTAALFAVVSHDERGPMLANAATDTTTGELTLADGQPASFSIRQ